MARRRGPSVSSSVPDFTPIGATCPLRGENPQNRPLSKLNTGRFALRAMLPVITLTICSILFLRTAKPGNNAIAFARWRTRVRWTSVSGNSTAINVFSCDHLTQVLWAYSFHRLLQAIIATYSNDNIFIMAALCNRAGHYIFAL